MGRCGRRILGAHPRTRRRRQDDHRQRTQAQSILRSCIRRLLRALCRQAINPNLSEEAIGFNTKHKTLHHRLAHLLPCAIIVSRGKRRTPARRRLRLTTGNCIGCSAIASTSPRLLARTAALAQGEYCHTMPALRVNPRLLQVSRRPAASQFLEQARPDLLPGDDIGGILLMPLDTVIELRGVCICQRQCVGFQAFPHHIQQFGFFGSGQIFYFVSQTIVYNRSAVSPAWQGCCLSC